MSLKMLDATNPRTHLLEHTHTHAVVLLHSQAGLNRCRAMEDLF